MEGLKADMKAGPKGKEVIIKWPENPTRRGAYVSLKKRCDELAKKAKSQFGAIKADFKPRACSCLGCCDSETKDDDCYFPVLISL
jgi:hypothetical protein